MKQFDNHQHKMHGAERQALVALIRRLGAPMEPQDADQAPRLKELPGVRAVLFDVYGTLFVSGSGDISVATGGEAPGACALESALAGAGFGIESAGAAREGAALFYRLIRSRHEQMKAGGTDCPEVDVRRIWTEVLGRLHEERRVTGDITPKSVRHLAAEYECRVNPVWPMPDAAGVLAELATRGMALGIVSNAQFYTPLLFDAFLGGSPEELGLEDALCVWSWRAGRAKPSPALHVRAAAELTDRHGITAGEALYVGNDMLNDIYAAQCAGFRTALYAGDRRSLRLRRSEARCKGVEPDVVLTRLGEIPDVVDRVD